MLNPKIEERNLNKRKEEVTSSHQNIKYRSNPLAPGGRELE
jgi:hypothetical protein